MKEAEKELNSIASDNSEPIQVRNKIFKVKGIKRGTLRFITNIMVNTATGLRQESTISCKVAAAVCLNNFFKLRLLHWFLWRWFYYIREYSDLELLPLVEFAKKKVELQEYLMITTLSIVLRDTQMMMTREEVSRMHREQALEQQE